MIIGYDFWVNDIFATDSKFTDFDSQQLLKDISFDNPMLLSQPLDKIEITNAIYDELEILRNANEVNTSTSKDNSYGVNTVILAEFQNNLSGGNISVGSDPIYLIQLLRRKKGETEWQVCQEVKYDNNVEIYYFTDRYIGAEQNYEYCIRPIARSYNDVGEYTGDIIGLNSPITETETHFDCSYLLGKDEDDKEVFYPLIYDFKFGDITSNINANVINTLGGQYPFTVYGSSKYKNGSVTCLLVTKESSTGTIDIKAEKELRDNIDKFLSNKKPKILKCDDGTFLLINISDNFTLTPNENLLGSYTLTFNYTEIGDANNIDDLKKYKLWSDN